MGVFDLGYTNLNEVDQIGDKIKTSDCQIFREYQFIINSQGFSA